LVDAIEAGDETTASTLARSHLEATQTYTKRRDAHREVAADLVRGTAPRP
jgi:DNA-binding FadR family transcriptional regulator